MTRVARLAVVLVVNLVLVGGLVAVGLSAHSLGVLAAGADYLADAAAIGVSLLAIWLSGRPVTGARPYGYPKATTVAAMVNSGWLLALSLFVIAEASRRLVSGTPHVHGLPVLVASGVAAMAMLVGALILTGDPNADDDARGAALNMRAVLLDTAGDAAAAAGIAVVGIIILITGRARWLDPTVAMAISLVIAVHAIALLRDATITLGRSTAEVSEQQGNDRTT